MNAAENRRELLLSLLTVHLCLKLAGRYALSFDGVGDAVCEAHYRNHPAE